MIILKLQKKNAKPRHNVKLSRYSVKLSWFNVEIITQNLKISRFNDSDIVSFMFFHES